jgi:hypothetical protein
MFNTLWGSSCGSLSSSVSYLSEYSFFYLRRGLSLFLWHSKILPLCKIDVYHLLSPTSKPLSHQLLTGQLVISTKVQISVPIMWHPGPNQTLLWLHSHFFFSCWTFSTLFWKGFLFFFFGSLSLFSSLFRL